MDDHLPHAGLVVPDRRSTTTPNTPCFTPSMVLDTDSTCDIYMFLLVGVFGSIVGLVGIIGNGLTLVVISRVGRGSITFYVLSILAVIDTIYLLCYILTQSIPDLIYYWDDFVPTDYARYALWAIFPIYCMASTASIWTTTLVTSYRYIIARGSIKQRKVYSRKSVKYQILIIIAASVVLDIPKYFERLPSFVTGVHTPILETTDLWRNRIYQLLYRTFVMVFLRAVLPIMVTTVMVYKRVQLLETWKKTRLLKFNKPDLPNDQERVSIVLVIMAMFFIVCQIPGVLYPVTRLFFDTDDYPDVEYRCDHFYIYLYTSADFLATMYSAFNFFIFYPSIPAFRKVLKQIICRSKATHRASIVTQQSIISTQRSRTLSTIM